jgi:DNA repair exonuclease SbcCD ATPase subunit
MEPEERFQRIEALLHAMAERENQMEILFNRRMEAFDRRMEAAEERMEKFEERMEQMDQKWDKRFEATRKLVHEGIKFVQRRDEQRDAKFAALVQTVDKLAKTQQTLIDSLRLGGNGNGRRRG